MFYCTVDIKALRQWIWKKAFTGGRTQRTDKNIWKMIESYLEKHADAKVLREMLHSRNFVL